MQPDSSNFLTIIGLFNFFFWIQSITCLTLPTVQTYKKEVSSSISIRLKNGQLLKGNRKLITELQNVQNQNVVYEFLSVPFAKPPLNELRFKFPAKLDKLLPEDFYDATNFRDSCVQEVDTTYPGFSGSEMWNAPGGISEDCLYMNIWVPVKKEQDQLYRAESNKANPEYLPNGFSLNSEDKATLLWIYGGSFSSGSANLNVYDGTMLAGLENVIILIPNYRVGPFGYLYLGNEKAPGNAGLADITVSLEVYRNNYLEFFGGSFNKICLFGESAGAMIIHNLLLSDHRNLFNRAILQSSSSYIVNSYRNREDSFQLAVHFAEKVGCLPNQSEYNFKNVSTLNILSIEQNLQNLENSNNEKILNCLLNQNASYLSQKQWEIEYVNEYLKMQFVPTLDYHNLLEQDPTEFDFKNNKKINQEILTGVNEDEGTYFLFYLYNAKHFNLTNIFNESDTKYNNDFVTSKLIDALRTKFPIANDYSHYDQFAKCLSSLYTINSKQVVNRLDYDLNTEENQKQNSPELAFQKLSKVLGDYIFSCPTIRFANKYSESQPQKSFFYKFSQRAKANLWPKWMGVIHAQEIEFIFGVPLLNSTLYDDDDRFTSRNIMSYWANFARFGKLKSPFDPIQKRKYFVDFSAELSKRNESTEQEQIDSFNKLHSNCELINKFESTHSFKTKLKMCKKHHESIGSYFNSSSSHLDFRLFCFLFMFFTRFFYFLFF